MNTLAVLMTTFNRRATTLHGLAALHRAAAHAGIDLRLYVVDDGSTDGTPQAVRERYPEATLLSGGNLYWCRGMHRAFAAALVRGHGAYLWLNDDTELMPDALDRLQACANELGRSRNEPVIVVGSTIDASGRPTYGGERQASRWRPLTLRLVPPGPVPQRIDTLNGNIVWINAAAAQRVGNLDAAFEHAMGDTDYGLRARACGVAVWLAPGVHGRCSLNAAKGTFADHELGRVRRLRLMLQRKGLPWRSWLRLTRRHGGWHWGLLFMWPYLQVALGRAPRRSTSRIAAS